RQFGLAPSTSGLPRLSGPSQSRSALRADAAISIADCFRTLGTSRRQLRREQRDEPGGDQDPKHQASLPEEWVDHSGLPLKSSGRIRPIRARRLRLVERIRRPAGALARPASGIEAAAPLPFRSGAGVADALRDRADVDVAVVDAPALFAGVRI